MSRATPEQHALARVAGIVFPRTLPVIVAAARLKSALVPHIGGAVSPPAWERKLEYLEGRAREQGRKPPKADSRDEAEAWIQYFHLQSRLRALQTLKFNAGDIVRRLDGNEDDLFEVASIGGDGTVYFKGGRARAWPDTLDVVARASEESLSAKRARQAAANRTALSAPTRAWSLVKQRYLAEFVTEERASESDIQRLEEILASAKDERPIQDFLESNPHLLTSLLSGRERYCVPQVRVGTKYVADFFIADVDSGGIRWVVVELESPQADVALKTKNQFAESARTGVSQIEEWREWLQNNLDQARRRKEEDGLGLFDIRPQVEGLVLVGRRHDLTAPAVALRRQLEEKRGIRMHTYDWLVEVLVGSMASAGPPVTNSGLLARPTEPNPLDEILE